MDGRPMFRSESLTIKTKYEASAIRRHHLEVLTSFLGVCAASSLWRLADRLNQLGRIVQGWPKD